MRRSIALVPVLLLLLAAQAHARSAYVVDTNGDQITPIDLATDMPGTPIPAGESPLAIAIEPNGKTAYFVNGTPGTVTPLDLATGTPGVPIPAELSSRLAIDPAGGSAYATSSGIDALTPIDLATGTPGAPIAGGEYPVGIAIAPKGGTAYVTNYEAASVTPIDLATATPGAPIPVGLQPIAIAIAPDGATAYVLTYNLTKAATEDNREFGMVNRSPSDVEELKRIFLADWNRQSYRPIDPDLVVSPDNARWRILGLMEQAQSELWVGVEVISDPEAMAILVEKKKAGVDVRLLIGGVKKVTANYAPMKYLVENGVPRPVSFHSATS